MIVYIISKGKTDDLLILGCQRLDERSRETLHSVVSVPLRLLLGPESIKESLFLTYKCFNLNRCRVSFDN